MKLFHSLNSSLFFFVPLFYLSVAFQYQTSPSLYLPFLLVYLLFLFYIFCRVTRSNRIFVLLYLCSSHYHSNSFFISLSYFISLNISLSLFSYYLCLSLFLPLLSLSLFPSYLYLSSLLNFWRCSTTKMSSHLRILGL